MIGYRLKLNLHERYRDFGCRTLSILTHNGERETTSNIFAQTWLYKQSCWNMCELDNTTVDVGKLCELINVLLVLDMVYLLAEFDIFIDV